jgi:hypothetical protein
MAGGADRVTAVIALAGLLVTACGGGVGGPGATDHAAPTRCAALAADALERLEQEVAELGEVVPGRVEPGAEAAVGPLVQSSPRRPFGGLAGRTFESRWTGLGCDEQDEFEALDRWAESFDTAAREAARATGGGSNQPVAVWTLAAAQLLQRHATLHPDRPRERERVRLEDLDELVPDADGVLLRLHLRDGEPQGLSLLQDGTVVAVRDTSVHGGRDAMRRWSVTSSTVEEVVSLVLQPGALGEPEPPAALGAGAPASAGGTLFHDDCCVAELPPALATAMVDLLTDQDRWTALPTRYRPTRLSVRARPAGSSDRAPRDLAPAQPWPLGQRIDQLGGEDTVDGAGEAVLQLCLDGQDAGAVWDLLVPGTNHAWLVVDDGDRWEVSLDLRWPGYRSSRDPC